MWIHASKFPVALRNGFLGTHSVSRPFGSFQQSAMASQVVEPICHDDKFRIIAAMSKNGVIGMNGGIPWQVPEDRHLFEQLTNQSILILGRRTFEEDPTLEHIHHARYCIVVSRSMTDIGSSYKKYCPNTTLELAPSFPDALALATRIRQQQKLQRRQDQSSNFNESNSDLDCWIAGGESLYRESLLHESAFQLHLSIVNLEIDVQGRDKDDIAMFPRQDLWADRFEKVAYKEYPQEGHVPSFSYHIYQRKD